MLINPNVIRIIRQNLNWIIIALFFFLFGIFLAAFALGNEDFFLTELTKSQQDLLAEMAEMIFAGPPLKGIAILFLNNLLVSLQMMIFGFFLGITPLIGLFTNGALLGSIIAGLEYQGASTLVFLSLGVLPHGIFELPAFIISAAFGLKLGFHLLFPLPQKKRDDALWIFFGHHSPDRSFYQWSPAGQHYCRIGVSWGLHPCFFVAGSTAARYFRAAGIYHKCRLRP